MVPRRRRTSPTRDGCSGTTPSDTCRKPPSDLGFPCRARGPVPAHSEQVTNRPSPTRGTAADAVATLAVLLVGASLLAIAAPLVSALAVLLTVALYLPMRVRVTADGTPAG